MANPYNDIPVDEEQDAPKANPYASIPVDKNPYTDIPTGREGGASGIATDLSSNDPMKVYRAQQNLVNQGSRLLNTGLQSQELQQEKAQAERDANFNQSFPDLLGKSLSESWNQPSSGIARGFNKVGDVVYEGGVNALQHNLEDFRGLPADTQQDPGLTTPEAIKTYPTPVQAGIKGVEGLVRSAPQMGIAAANPLAGAFAFGATEQGFSPKQAAIAAALPYIGKYAGALTEAIASKARVGNEAAKLALNKLGGAAGAAGAIGADEVAHIMSLPEDERKDAWVNAIGNVGGMFLLGTMGERHQFGEKAAPKPAQFEWAKTDKTPAQLKDLVDRGNLANGLESVALDPATGNPISNAKSTLEKADARIAELNAEKERTQNAGNQPISARLPESEVRAQVGPETSLRQQGETASAPPLSGASDGTVVEPKPVEAQKVEAPVAKSDSEIRLELDAEKANGTITPERDALREKYIAAQKARDKAGFGDMMAQLKARQAKIDAEKAAADKPNADVPALEARGYDELRRSKMTPEQKAEALSKPIPTLEEDQVRNAEIQDALEAEKDPAKRQAIYDKFGVELELLKKRNTKNPGFPPDRPSAKAAEPKNAPEPVSAEIAPTETPGQSISEIGAGPGAATSGHEALNTDPNVSIAKANVNERRAKEGNLPLLEEDPLKNAEAYSKAEDIVAKDRDAGQKLVDALRNGTKTSLDVIEQAVLANESVTIQNERAAAAERASDPHATEEARAEAHLDWAKAEEKLNELDQATQMAGRSAARVLQWRKNQIATDWTFQGIEQRARANKGRGLYPEESKKIKEEADQIADTDEKIAEREAKGKAEQSESGSKEEFESVKKDVQASEKKNKAKGQVVDVAKQRENIVSGMKERISEGDSINDLYSYVQKLHENLQREAIQSGKTLSRGEVTDAIHNILTNDLGLKLPKEFTGKEGEVNTQDLISGIGRQIPLTTDQAKLAKSEVRTQLQKVGKINRFLQKMAAPFTGLKRKPTTAEVRALEKEGRELARKNGIQVTDPAKQLATSLEAKKTRLRNEIADMDRAISLKEPMVSKSGVVVNDAATEALTAARDAKRAEYKAIFQDEAMPPETRLKIALDAAIKNEQIAKATLENARKGIFNRAKEGPRLSSAEIEVVKARIEAYKAEVEELRKIAEPGRTPEEIAMQSAKTRATNEIAKNLDKVARNDFSKPPARKKLVPDKELTDLRTKNEEIKQKIARGFALEQEANRPKWMKALEQVSGFARFNALMGYHTLGKLAGFSVARFGEIPVTEIAGGVLSKIPGHRDLFRGANLESGHTAKAIKNFYVKAITKGASEAWRMLKTGNTEAKLLHERPNYVPPKWFDFPGRIHTAEKTPLLTGAQAMYETRAVENAQRLGLNLSDEFVRGQINKEVHDHANPSILQEQNGFAQWFNGLHRWLEKVDPKTGHADITRVATSHAIKTLLTKGIVKTPANYFMQTIKRTPIGLAGAYAKLAVAKSRGMSNLTRLESNAIAGLIKTGWVGSAMFLYGMIDATKKEEDRVFGGYWEPGRKKGGKDVEWGKLRIDGHTLPHIATHNPFTEAGQLGNTMMRVAMSRFRKKDKDTQGLMAGAVQSLLTLVGKAPITNPVMRAGQHPGSLAPDLIGGLSNQLLQNIAEDLDDKERDPQNALDKLKMGIPGLRETVPVKGAKKSSSGVLP
jgi:hypothetical protein